jgi:Cation transporter/ATPase, N-terminus
MSGAASLQQVASGGFTAAEAAHRLAEYGYNELLENGAETYSILGYIPEHSLTN